MTITSFEMKLDPTDRGLRGASGALLLRRLLICTERWGSASVEDLMEDPEFDESKDRVLQLLEQLYTSGLVARDCRGVEFSITSSGKQYLIEGGLY